MGKVIRRQQLFLSFRRNLPSLPISRVLNQAFALKANGASGFLAGYRSVFTKTPQDKSFNSCSLKVSIGGSSAAIKSSGSYTYVWSPTTSLDFVTVANPMTTPDANWTDTSGIQDLNESFLTLIKESIGGSPATSKSSGSYTYVWSPTTGLSSITTANPTANLDANRIYTLNVSNTNKRFYSNSIRESIGGSSAAIKSSSSYTYVWSPTTSLSSIIAANPTANLDANRIYTLNVSNTSKHFYSNSIRESIGGSSAAIKSSGSYTYVWSPTTGLGSNTVANPTANPGANRIYTLNVLNANKGFCLSSERESIRVRPLQLKVQVPIHAYGPLQQA